MADKEAVQKGISPDWLVRGILTKIGDTFDRVTGRGWKPSSSLATSELIERMKALLDVEARDEAPRCKFVPNNIKLKMQWNKFSTDADESLKKLQNELLAAAIDHINDKRYFTHAPLSLEIKPDYFTPGVRLLVSFDKFEDEERGADIHVSQDASVDEPIASHRAERTFVATYSTNSVEKEWTLALTKGARLSVGRTKENSLSIDDPSVSKIHASLTVDDDGKLIVADTGSTNGTFVAGQRISYGKAVIVGDGGAVKFGGVDVAFRPVHIPKPEKTLLAPNDETPLPETVESIALAETVQSLGEEEGFK